MEYNYNQFALLFNRTCLSTIEENILHDYGLYVSGSYVKTYIPTSNLTSFILSFDGLAFLKECILEWNYEYIVPLEACENFRTNTFTPEAWPLDLLDPPLDHTYHVSNTVNPNVDLWILDTGVWDQHMEFEPGQVQNQDPTFNLTHPHGTGTASCAAGKRYGSSKKTLIYSLPTCKFAGSCGSADIDAALQHMLQHVKNRHPQGKRSVINMSFGVSFGDKNPRNTSLGQYYDHLFQEITSYGGIVVVSAGNSDQNACNWFYSFSPHVISVGSIDYLYRKSSFSNWGSCVDLWSFGSDVPLAYSITNRTNIQLKSGTSFSAPLVSGLIVNLLSYNLSYTRTDLLNLLFSRVNGFFIPRYNCGNYTVSCCKSSTTGTRLDAWCKQQSLSECDRTCKIQTC